MTSKEDKKWLGLMVNFTYYSGGCPLLWDFEKDKLTRCTSKFGYYKWIFSFWHYISFLVYTIGSCIEARIHSRPIVEFNILFFVFVICSLPAITMTVFMLKGDDLMIYMNSLEEYANLQIKKFSITGKAQPNKFSKWINAFLKLLYFMTRWYGIMCGLLSLARPYAPAMISSKIPIQYRFSFIPIIQAVIIAQLVTAGVGATCSLAGITFCSLIPLFETIDEFNLSGKSVRKRWTKPAGRHYHNLILQAHSFRIMNTLIESWSRSICMPIQQLISRTVHICSFMLIRHRHEMPLLSKVISMTLPFVLAANWVGLMQCAAVAYKLCSHAWTSWKVCYVPNPVERRVFHKQRKAMVPIGLKVGDFYVVKHKTVLKIVSTYFRGTIRLLVAVRK